VRLTRREAVAAAGGFAALLAGCGGSEDEGPQARDVARRSIAIDFASYYAPIEDLRRLVEARAAQRGASVLFSSDPSGSPAQLASLRKLTGERGGFKVVVVAAFDPTAVAAIVADARTRDIDVVSFITPVAGTRAAIALDADRAAALLARDVARRGLDAVTLIAPPARSPVPNPFLPYAAGASRALAAELGRAGIDVTRTVVAVGAADAALAVGDARAVLAWNDETALGAAQAVGRSGYVGAIADPAVTGRPTLDALDGPGPLTCVISPRLSALADALVDVPLALLRGQKPPSAPIALQRLVRGSSAVTGARQDYA
jgi:DNA-binding LacI/PurR family transcriptional regulator